MTQASHARAAVREQRRIHSLLDPIGKPESVGGMLARNTATTASSVSRSFVSESAATCADTSAELPVNSLPGRA